MTAKENPEFDHGPFDIKQRAKWAFYVSSIIPYANYTEMEDVPKLAENDETNT